MTRRAHVTVVAIWLGPLCLDCGDAADLGTARRAVAEGIDSPDSVIGGEAPQSSDAPLAGIAATDGTEVKAVQSIAVVADGTFRPDVADPLGPQCSGDAVAFIADVTGDSIDDLMIGATGCVTSNLPGRAYVLASPLRLPSSATDAIAVIRSTDSSLGGGWGGMGVGDLGDLDGDGWPELYFSAPAAVAGGGQVDLFSTPVSGDLIDGDSDSSLCGDTGTGPVALGSAITSLDATRWVVSGYSTVTNRALVYVLDGMPVPNGTPDSAAYVLTASRPGETLAAMDGGDVDGDGLRDLAIGYPDAEGKAGGRLALIPGPVESDAVVEDVATIWLGSSPAIHFAEAVSIVGDADGDGTGDIAVGAWDASELFEDGGAAYLIHGGALIPAERSVDDVDLKIESENAFDSLGDAVSGLGDLDGDGLAEIGVTATRSSGNVDGTVPARVYLVRSPPAGGVVSAGDLDAALIGSVDEEVVAYGYAFSSLLAGGADTDLDGTPEFLVGSPLFDGEYYERVGRVDLIEGWPF